METSGPSEESALDPSYAGLCAHLPVALHQPGMTTVSRRRNVLNSRPPIARFPAEPIFSRETAESRGYLPGRLGWSKDDLART